MSSKNISKIAGSNYRQARVTFTQEASGRLSLALYAKGLNQAWTEHSCLDRWYVNLDHPVTSMDDVVEAIVHGLRERRLPGI